MFDLMIVELILIKSQVESYNLQILPVILLFSEHKICGFRPWSIPDKDGLVFNNKKVTNMYHVDILLYPLFQRPWEPTKAPTGTGGWGQVCLPFIEKNHITHWSRTQTAAAWGAEPTARPHGTRWLFMFECVSACARLCEERRIDLCTQCTLTVHAQNLQCLINHLIFKYARSAHVWYRNLQFIPS